MITVAPGGRSAAIGQLSFGGGRLKNHAGKSGRSRYARVMMAEHAGSAARQSARRSHACGAPVASFANGRAGSNLTHQPSGTKSMAEPIFQTTRAMMHRWARVVRRNRA